MISTILAVTRISLLVILVMVGLIAGLLSPLMSKRLHRGFIKTWHKLVLAILGIKLKLKGQTFQAGTFVVANHISWLDISVLGSSLPTTFLAKQEVSGWPILGFVVQKAGTLFIERGKGAKRAIEQITDSLENGFSVVVFPEGKTTDGVDVNRFQPRLFQSAIDAKCAVQPIALRYLDKAGAKQAGVSYSGNLSFLQSLWKVAGLTRINATASVLPVIPVSESRDQMSKQAEEMIRNVVKSC